MRICGAGNHVTVPVGGRTVGSRKARQVLTRRLLVVGHRVVVAQRKVVRLVRLEALACGLAQVRSRARQPQLHTLAPARVEVDRRSAL